METLADLLLKACQDSWEENNLPGMVNKKNCSGFLRSVACHLGKPLSGPQADDLVEFIRQNWRKVATASNTILWVIQGATCSGPLEGE